MPRRPPARGESTPPRTHFGTEDRPNSNARGYGYRWQQFRESFLAKNPLCVKCLEAGWTESAHHVDHIIPVENAEDALFWDPDNHQALCASCHSRKTRTEDM